MKQINCFLYFVFTFYNSDPVKALQYGLWIWGTRGTLGMFEWCKLELTQQGLAS